MLIYVCVCVCGGGANVDLFTNFIKVYVKLEHGLLQFVTAANSAASTDQVNNT